MDCSFKTAFRIRFRKGWCHLCFFGIHLQSLTREDDVMKNPDDEEYRPSTPEPKNVKLCGYAQRTVPSNADKGTEQRLAAVQSDRGSFQKNIYFVPSKDELLAQKKLLKSVSSSKSDTPRADGSEQELDDKAIHDDA